MQIFNEFSVPPTAAFWNKAPKCENSGREMHETTNYMLQNFHAMLRLVNFVEIHSFVDYIIYDKLYNVKIMLGNFVEIHSFVDYISIVTAMLSNIHISD